MERMIFERQRRASPNLPPSALDRGKEYGGTSGKALDRSITVHVCPRCSGRTWVNGQPYCYDCLMVENEKVRLEPHTYVPASTATPESENTDG